MVRLFFDTETTGLPARFGAPAEDLAAWDPARLVQLSWILYNDDARASEGDFIIRPDGFEIPKEASAIHGISMERALEEGVPLKKAVYYFLGAARMADVVIGHNVQFDLGVVGAELVRTWGKNYLDGVKVYDTMKESAKFVGLRKAGGGLKWPKLVELYSALFGKEFEGAHNSMADVEATVDCYLELVMRGIMV